MSGHEYDLSGGIRLKEDMRILGSTSKSYTLVIPNIDPHENEHLASWYNDILGGGSWSNDLRMAKDVFRYISRNFKTNEDGSQEGFNRPNGGRMSLNAALEHKKGVCKEKAALFQIIAQNVGLESLYVRGYQPDVTEKGKRIKRRHAWNKVKIQGHMYYVDPTNGYFSTSSESYSNAIKDYLDLREGENNIEMPYKVVNGAEMRFIEGKAGLDDYNLDSIMY